MLTFHHLLNRDALVRDVDDGKVKDTISEYTVFGDLSIALMALGLFVLITGLLGMCGSCCANKCMLVSVSDIAF